MEAAQQCEPSEQAAALVAALRERMRAQTPPPANAAAPSEQPLHRRVGSGDWRGLFGGGADQKDVRRARSGPPTVR